MIPTKHVPATSIFNILNVSVTAKTKNIIGRKLKTKKTIFKYFNSIILLYLYVNNKPIIKATENRIVQLLEAHPNVNVTTKARIVMIFHFLGNNL